ncbi:Hypothetical protein D9617_4g000880 [Elsinoe fawcettii]|nr:Hypothetical protein D9617_4g000880 [Elsinoe fawcettii]
MIDQTPNHDKRPWSAAETLQEKGYPQNFAQFSSEKEYNPRDHDAPQVVDHASAPQLAYDRDHFSPKVALDREYHDAGYPEVVHAHYASGPAGYGYGHNGHGELPAQDTQPQKSGLRRRTWWMIIALALIVILSAGLGAGLGIGLRNRNSQSNTTSTGADGANGNNSSSTTSGGSRASNASSVLERTGIAMTNRGDGAGFLAYYQAPNGSLIEDFFSNPSLADITSSSFRYNPTERTIIPAPGIVNQTPIAATSYNLSGTTYRHVFYTNSQGQILETNSTSTSPQWSTPYVILDSTYFGPTRISANSPGLAACTGPSIPTLFLIYANTQGFHDLLARNLTAPSTPTTPSPQPWRSDQIFILIDKLGGVTCSVQPQSATSPSSLFPDSPLDGGFVDIWAGNFTGDTLAHWTMDWSPQGYRRNFSDWQENIINRNPASGMASYGAMAYAYPQGGGDGYLFYQGTDDGMAQVVQPLEPLGPGSGVAKWEGGGMMRGTKIAAGWVGQGDGELVVLFQSNSSEIRAVRPNRNGAVLGNGTFIGAG